MTRRRELSGYSFMELLVASMLLAMISLAIMRLGPALYGGTRSLTARARSVGELRMAAETILQDMGGADSVEWMDEDRLSITRERQLAEWQGAWVPGPGDAGIQYELTDDGLERSDLALGTTVIVAREIDAFVVERTLVLGLIETEVLVTLASGEGEDEISYQLVWRN